MFPAFLWSIFILRETLIKRFLRCKIDCIEWESDMKSEELMLQSVENADLVLVGIGKEFLSPFAEFDALSDNYIFEEQIRKMNLFSFFHDALLKRWMQQTDNEGLVQAYRNLSKLLDKKNYYVISLCYDDQIYDSGLQEEFIVTPCGGYRRIQMFRDNQQVILSPEETKNIEDEIYQAFEKKDFQMLKSIDSKYHECKPAYNLILCEDYNEKGYLDQWNRYLMWIQGTVNKRLCVLEFGVDLQFPSVIRWPFERVVQYNQKADFYRVHEHLYQLPIELGDRGIAIKENSVAFLGKLFV